MVGHVGPPGTTMMRRRPHDLTPVDAQRVSMFELFLVYIVGIWRPETLRVTVKRTIDVKLGKGLESCSDCAVGNSME